MTAPTTVAVRSIVVDGKELTVSTVRVAADYYDTVIFDNSSEKKHRGMFLGGYVIDHSSKRAADREAGLENHREAIRAARLETPRTVRS